MKPLTNNCAACSRPMDPAPTGRPRLYCSDRCRQAARRRRLVAQAAAPVAETDLDDLDELGLVGIHDPDAAVLEAVLLARGTASRFAAVAPYARRELSWRCDAMAQHIAAGVKRFFEP